VITFGYFDATRYQKEIARTNGKVAPEHRLYAAMFGSFLLPIGLFVRIPTWKDFCCSIPMSEIS